MIRISVALCTYNGSTFIHEQLDSILSQTTPVNEIIVCDDGSTDDTLAILNQYSIENPGLFKIVQNEINLKSVKNFEKAISLCTGDIIFLADQDDVWLTNKVEAFVSYFEMHQNINVLASNGHCLDEKGINHEKYSVWDVPVFLKEKGLEVDFYKIISFRGNLATGATMALRKNFVQEVIPFPIIKEYHHDEWIALVAAKTNSFELLDKKYIHYRIHEKQQVGGVFFDNTEQTKQDLIQIYDTRFITEIEVLSFINSKRRLKKIISCIDKNRKLSLFIKTDDNIYNDNRLSLTEIFYSTKKAMKKRYPIQARLLFLSDKITGKRQLKD
jgi:glycosyltransferase involved in cell wall biosynthesis